MAADNASVLVGKNNSLMTRLKQDADESFFAIRCICHSLHIAASKAAATLPKNIEDLIRNIASYFSHSSKRQAELFQLQQYLSAEKAKILRPADTRWLALQKCVERILSQWEVLKLLFFQAQVEDKLVSADLIMKDLNNPFTKAYLTFMNYTLTYFNQLNALFQSKISLIGILQEESLRMARLLCKNFIKPQYLNDLSKIEPFSSTYLLPLNKICLGSECENILSAESEGLEAADIDKFRERCLIFYQTSYGEIKKRLPLFDPLFTEMKFLKPAVALDPNARDKLPRLDTLIAKYSHLLESGNNVNNEWGDIPAYSNVDETEMLKNMSDEFWSYLKNLKNFSDQYVFSNIASLAILILTLPHSNAETERIFSFMVDSKTKKRNRMGPELLDSILFVNSNLKAKDKSCLDFAKEIDETHIACHNQAMYDFK